MGRDAIQRDLDMPERWANASLVKFNKVKCNALHLVERNPKHKHRLGKEVIQSNPKKKDLKVLV